MLLTVFSTFSVFRPFLRRVVGEEVEAEADSMAAARRSMALARLLMEFSIILVFGWFWLVVSRDSRLTVGVLR
jgi:hypothetical protein